MAYDRSARRYGRSRDFAVILDALGALDRAARLESPPGARLAGASGAQWRALLAIAEGPGSSMSEVARRTGTDISSVSVVVKGLAARGLVTRTVGKRDRRRVTSGLTARGREAVGRARDRKSTRIGRAAVALSPRARHALAAHLTRLLAALRGGTRPSDIRDS
ncbi:MAG TPA: MarR family transcriptional regulator [Gemmatimonadaceae bacterium]|nr:MarR family transcriptional regulator [Gemmatimonadaceae bacterium]